MVAALLRIRYFLRFRRNFLSGADALVAFDNDLIAFFEVTEDGDPGALSGAKLDRSGADSNFVSGRGGDDDHRRRSTEDDGVFGHQYARRWLSDRQRHAGKHARLEQRLVVLDHVL